MKLIVGDSAPDFKALDQDEKKWKLSDFSDNWLVLYFYPRDNTPGCTKEACGIRNNYDDLRGLAKVVGVSSNSVESHKKFADKFELPFVLLADPDKKILSAYGADGIIMAKRVTFLIDPLGKIAKIYDKVTPDSHASELLEDLKKIQ